MSFRRVTVDHFEAIAEPAEINTEVSATGGVLDIGKSQATGVTASIVWGDGMCDIVPVEDGSIDAQHSYAEAGVFTLTLHVYAGSAEDWEDCAAAELLELIDEATYSYVVIYDPDGGFMTGGGWIDSPEGAYRDDPLASGRQRLVSYPSARRVLRSRQGARSSSSMPVI